MRNWKLIEVKFCLKRSDEMFNVIFSRWVTIVQLTVFLCPNLGLWFYPNEDFNHKIK